MRGRFLAHAGQDCMDKESGNIITATEPGQIENAEDSGVSRRKFTRGAVLGGSVLFTLSNRPAWSQGHVTVCASTGVLTSVGPAQISSHHTSGELEQKQADLNFVNQLITDNPNQCTVVQDDDIQKCVSCPPGLIP